MNPRVSLSGLDSAFLSLETPTTPMNVMGTFVLEVSGANGGYYVRGVSEIALGFGAAVGRLLKSALEKTAKSSRVVSGAAPSDPASVSAGDN